MKDKRKLAILASFWLLVSALVIFALTGIMTPSAVSTPKHHPKLLGSVVAHSDEKTDILLEAPGGGEFRAALSLDSGNRHAIRSALGLPGNLENLHIDSDRSIAYLANNHAGLQIVDIADPDNVRLIGSIATPGNAWDITIRHDTLFLAAAKGGLQIYDISTPATPAKISELILPGLPLLKLSLLDQTIYASSGSKGLQVIDITNPETPVHKRTLLAKEGAWSLVNDGKNLYVAAGRYFCNVYDLDKPHQPRLLSRFEVPRYVRQMAAYRDMLYVPVREKGLMVFDISDPANLHGTGWSSGTIDVETIEIKEDRAYLSNRRGDLYSYDLTDPARPHRLSLSDIPFKPRNIAVHDGLIFVAAGLSGLQVFDTSRLPKRKLVPSLQVPGKLLTTLSDEKHYYLATSTNGLLIAEKTEPGALPRVIATLPVPGAVFDMVRSGDHLFLACNQSGLQVVDISMPGRPKLVAGLNFSGEFRDLALNGKQLYVAAGERGLLSFNISFPEAPILIGNLPKLDTKNLFSVGNRLYTLTQNGELHIIDITNPAEPVRISSCPISWPLRDFVSFHELKVADKTAFFAAGRGKLILFDLTDEYHPAISRIVSFDGEVIGVKVIQSDVFVTTRQGRMVWLQQKKDGSFIRRAKLDTLGTAYDFDVDKGTFVLTNGYKGLTFLPMPLELSIDNRHFPYSRTVDSSLRTAEIPPRLQPGVYNLTVSSQAGMSNFIGAVRVMAGNDVKN